jgi:histidine kinase/DNA gyrase B/HSP90-like ATPase
MTPAKASRRHLRSEVARICAVARQCAFLLAAAVSTLSPTTAGLRGTAFLTGLAMWAIYRLTTRSSSRIAIAGDAVCIAAVGAVLPLVATDPEVTHPVSVAQAVVGVSLASLGVQLRVGWSLAALLLGVVGYAIGSSASAGWHVPVLANELVPILCGWLVAVTLREAIERVANTADQAHLNRLDAEIANGIAEARRKADREQLALLHDTAAATLLLVATEARAPVERLAAQATRDLALLEATPIEDPSAPIDVIPLLREEASYLDCPVELTGLDHLWLDGEFARALSAASREVLNNVDRHAHASSVTIYAGRHRLEITDDGRGFTADCSHGHGIDESIVARMHRAGGHARINSVPGHGTTVDLHWQDGPGPTEPANSSDETESLVRSVTAAYRLALITAGVVLLAVAILHGPLSGHQLWVEVGLAVAAAICTSAAAVTRLREARWTVWVVTAALVGISAAQDAALDNSELLTYAHWSIGAISFCLLPFLVHLPAVRSLAILVTAWVIPAMVDLHRDHSPNTLVYLGVAAIAFFVPQVALCLLSSSIRDALRLARRENQARLRVDTKDAIDAAMQAECIRRYSDTVDRLVPLLRTLSRGGPITDELRRRSRAECRRLRTLFDESTPDAALLAERIQSLIDNAEQRGVTVTAHVDSDLPKLSRDTTEHVLGQVAMALEHAVTWARVVLTGAQAEVDLSVVCDVVRAPGDDFRRQPGRPDVLVAEDTMWMTLRAG